MFFFIDESWQENRHRVGTLSALGIPSAQINRFDEVVYRFMHKYLDIRSGEFRELKGSGLVKQKFYALPYSRNLSLTREILHFLRGERCPVFASVCFDESMIQLNCPDEARLDLPFRFLFERIASYMDREHPDKIATLIMDERSSRVDNARVAATVSRFFSRHRQARTYRIHRSPYFSSSRDDVGTQLADIICYCIGLHFSGERYAEDLFRIIKEMEYHYEAGSRKFHSIRKINPPSGRK